MKKIRDLKKCIGKIANIFLKFAIFVNLRVQGFLHYYEIVKYSCMLMGFLKFCIILVIQSYLIAFEKLNCTIANAFFFETLFLIGCVPRLKCLKTADCITNYSSVMIFATRELPQYIVVQPTGGKMSDMNHISQ